MTDATQRRTGRFRALEGSSRDGFTTSFIAIALWLGIFGAWLSRLLFLAAPQSRNYPRWRLRWSLPMLILCAAVALMVVELPLRLRFEASRAPLDALVAAMATGDVPTPDSVGLFDIEQLERTPDGIHFLVRDSGFIDRFGFAYAADGDPYYPSTEDTLRPLGGGWFIWIRAF